jgi:4-aminobutyrate aminotransferase-like enzyme
MQAKHENIGDVRGAGLFLAVDLVQDRSSKAPAADGAKRVVNAIRNQEGVLISRIGPSDNVLKIRPPMVLSRQNADQLVSALDNVLRQG